MRHYLSLLPAILCGCSFLTPPIEKPVIEDQSGLLGTFATVAERRMVITKKIYPQGLNQHTDNPGYSSAFCAEPPPDSTQSIASSLTAAFKAEASKGDSKQNINGETAKALITTARSMFTRSQGVQLFRDGIYNLCQAHLNQALKDGEYSQKFSELLKASQGLIAMEILKGANPDTAAAVAAANVQADAREAAAAAEIEKLKAAAQTRHQPGDATKTEAPAAGARGEKDVKK